ncbi:MAG: tetratricopeptide repeat protein, partial [Deltaproteobacteria bacterium]|nr:tetratricopeptide repeat protein [Deltaproteobacteria bacterium]
FAGNFQKAGVFKMNSHPTKDTLMEAHLEGEKGPVALHLSECAECRDYMSDLETIEDRASHKFSASAAVLENIRKKARVTRKSGFTFAFRWPQLAGMAVIGLVIGLNFINKEAPPLPAESNSAPTQNREPTAPVMNAGYSSSMRGLILSPKKADPLFSLAEELESQNRFEDAARLYEALSEKNSGTPEGESALYHLASCLEKSGRNEEALEKLKVLERINPRFPGLNKFPDSD